MMPILDFAEGVQRGTILLPKDRVMASLLIHQSCYRNQDFDPESDFYLLQLGTANKVLLNRIESARLREQKAVQERVDSMAAEIWKVLKANFVWHYPQQNKVVELDAKIRYDSGSALGARTMRDGGATVRYELLPCVQLAKGVDIQLAQHLERWIKSVAEGLVRTGSVLKTVSILKKALDEVRTLEINCPYASPLIDPRLGCSVFLSSSHKALGCSSIKLTLQEK